jgi:hypothetical protein
MGFANLTSSFVVVAACLFATGHGFSIEKRMASEGAPQRPTPDYLGAHLLVVDSLGQLTATDIETIQWCKDQFEEISASRFFGPESVPSAAAAITLCGRARGLKGIHVIPWLDAKPLGNPFLR